VGDNDKVFGYVVDMVKLNWFVMVTGWY